MNENRVIRNEGLYTGTVIVSGLLALVLNGFVGHYVMTNVKLNHWQECLVAVVMSVMCVVIFMLMLYYASKDK